MWFVSHKMLRPVFSEKKKQISLSAAAVIGSLRVNYHIWIFDTYMYVRKCTFRQVHLAKNQIFLRALWSESSLGTFWIAKDAKFLNVDIEDWSDCAVWFESSLSAHFRRYVISHCDSHILIYILLYTTVIVGRSYFLHIFIPLSQQNNL